jgi:molybdopterin molybdotransferase
MSTLSFAEARHVVEQHAARLRPTDPELTSLLAARNCVLAENLTADRDFPPFPRATRDGYALRAADIATPPARLKLTGELRAGADPAALNLSVHAGETVAIMTGAPVPPGADAVVMLEYTQRDADHIIIERTTTAGENIVPAGSEARAGQTVLPRGTRLDAAAIAVAASVGKTDVLIHRRPRVAILSTGDEVVDIAATPGRAQIRNSNSYALAALVAELGGLPVQLPIAPDEPDPLRHLIQEGLTADLLLLSGGVSMGKYDLVEQVLADFNATFFFTSVAIQPGKPLVFGKASKFPVPSSQFAEQPGKTSRAADAFSSGFSLGGDFSTAPLPPPPTENRELRTENWESRTENCFFLGLPGNPVSTLVCCELFAQPLIAALSGGRPEALRWLRARLAADIRTKPGLTRFVPGQVTGEFDAAEVKLATWQGSGDMIAVAHANCWLVIPPERSHIRAGEDIGVILRR